MLNHSHKRKDSLETCTQLLLQDFFASARPNRVHKFFFTEECSTLLAQSKNKSYHSSKKNRNTEKQFYP